MNENDVARCVDLPSPDPLMRKKPKRRRNMSARRFILKMTLPITSAYFHCLIVTTRKSIATKWASCLCVHSLIHGAPVRITVLHRCALCICSSDYLSPGLLEGQLLATHWGLKEALLFCQFPSVTEPQIKRQLHASNLLGENFSFRTGKDARYTFLPPGLWTTEETGGGGGEGGREAVRSGARSARPVLEVGGGVRGGGGWDGAVRHISALERVERETGIKIEG